MERKDSFIFWLKILKVITFNDREEIMEGKEVDDVVANGEEVTVSEKRTKCAHGGSRFYVEDTCELL